MSRYVLWWDKETQSFRDVTPRRDRRVDAKIFVKTDEIAPTASPFDPDGKEVFTSMSKYKEHLKENGYEITGGDHFTGNKDAMKPYQSNHEETRDIVARTLNDLRYGNVPTTEREREICQREERKYQDYKSRQ